MKIQITIKTADTPRGREDDVDPAALLGIIPDDTSPAPQCVPVSFLELLYELKDARD